MAMVDEFADKIEDNGDDNDTEVLEHDPLFVPC